MKNKMIVFLSLIVVSFIFTPVNAQSAVTLSNPKVDYIFGQRVTFNLQVSDTQQVSDAILFFRADGELNTHAERANITPEGINYTHNMSAGPLRPFAQVNFWARLTLKDGSVIESGQYFFAYTDNRFAWQEITGPQLLVHWYESDASFGQQALDVSTAALIRINQYLPVSPARPIHIYIYANPADLTSALELNGQSWAGGHTSPDLRVIVVSIPAGAEQGLQMDRKIPHELGHALLYEYTGVGYDRLPVWLREGFSSIIETSPNPDEALAIQTAVEKNNLIPMAELCNAFPPDASRAFLAYAQSASFTQYLLNKFGNTGLQALTGAYAKGLDCEQGAIQVFGKSLSELEAEWRNTVLGENQLATGLYNLMPYIVLFILILVFPLLINFFSFQNKQP